jgi:hypothetical protein
MCRKSRKLKRVLLRSRAYPTIPTCPSMVHQAFSDSSSRFPALPVDYLKDGRTENNGERRSGKFNTQVRAGQETPQIASHWLAAPAALVQPDRRDLVRLPGMGGGTFLVGDIPPPLRPNVLKSLPQKFFSPYFVRVFCIFLLALCCRKKVLTYIPIKQMCFTNS